MFLFLGLLLFIIYLNDIINVSYTFIHVIYANDTALFPTLSAFFDNKTICVQKLNEELNLINDWFKLNKLSLNINKTTTMFFHTTKHKVDNFQIKITDMNIEFVNKFNYLSIVIDNIYHGNVTFDFSKNS